MNPCRETKVTRREHRDLGPFGWKDKAFGKVDAGSHASCISLRPPSYTSVLMYGLENMIGACFDRFGAGNAGCVSANTI